MVARGLILSVVCFLCTAVFAAAREGYVVRIEDDGVIVFSENRDLSDPLKRYSFYGVEVPTVRQPMGPEALAWLREQLPPGKKINVDAAGKEEASGTRAMVRIDSDSVNYQLLAQGYAWINRALCRAVFCRRWYIQEHHAVQEKRGLWSLGLSTPPWQWSR
ncbi:MAG: thermonuclease family protein [Desulfovibrio sp.]|nr:thermonuclease family protein [Desulfovibrio sp.]